MQNSSPVSTRAIWIATASHGAPSWTGAPEPPQFLNFNPIIEEEIRGEFHIFIAFSMETPDIVVEIPWSMWARCRSESPVASASIL